MITRRTAIAAAASFAILHALPIPATAAPATAAPASTTLDREDPDLHDLLLSVARLPEAQYQAALTHLPNLIRALPEDREPLLAIITALPDLGVPPEMTFSEARRAGLVRLEPYDDWLVLVPASWPDDWQTTHRLKMRPDRVMG